MFFIYWLRTRQDTIDITTHVLLENTTANASILKEQLGTLFDRYVSDTTVLSGYCKNKVEESREHNKHKAELQGQIQGLKDYQARLIDSIEWHRNEIRKDRLDTADYEKAIAFEKERFSAMQNYYQHMQKARDRAHEQDLAEAQANRQSLIVDYADLQVHHDAMKMALAASERKYDQQTHHVNGLEKALEAAYDLNDRLNDLVNEYHTARPESPPASVTNITVTGGLLTEGEEDDIKDEVDDIMNDEEDIKVEDEFIKDEDDEAPTSMAATHPLSSPPHTMYGLEGH